MCKHFTWLTFQAVPSDRQIGQPRYVPTEGAGMAIVFAVPANIGLATVVGMDFEGYPS